MTRVRLPGIAKTRAKLRDGTVRTYWYAWRGGPRLPGAPGSPEFVRAYYEAHEAREDHERRARKRKTMKRARRSTPTYLRVGAPKVYFVTDGELVKIGMAVDPEQRLSVLQTGNPRRLRLLKVMEGGPDMEAWLHREFKPLHVQGEWFRLEGALSDFLVEEMA